MPGQAPGRGLFQLPARETLENFQVALAGSRDDRVAQARRGRILVPADRFERVTNVLLVERGLRSPGTVEIGGPKPRGVGGQDLVRQNQRGTIASELEFGVGDQDAPGFGMLAGPSIDGQTEVTFRSFPATAPDT